VPLCVQVNVGFGMDAVSKSAVSRMKKRAFRNVDVKKVGSTFSKCSKYMELKEFQCAATRNSAEEKKWLRRFDEYMVHQLSCRKLYYSWRTESDRSPLEILRIIHDDMDSRKTALPRLRVITKGSSGLGQLPMTLTGMLTHGHGDGIYADFSTDFWPRNSNFTISSLASYIRCLERPAVRNSKALFEERPLSPFFEKLMRGKSRCNSSIPVATDVPDHCEPLPRRLYLQLDNSPKDNKNQFLFGFLLLLTARKVFEGIQLGFLLVGHTYEDIDGYFSYVSDVLRKKNTFVLADLMKYFMDSQKLRFMPHVVQEVADFKSFVKSYALPLEGMKDMHIFRFFIDRVGWLVFQYKAFATDPDWLPRGSPHHMWRADSDGSPVTPVGNFRTFPPTYVLGWRALPIPVEATLLAEDGEHSPSLSRPPSWRRMGSALHPYRGRPAGNGWGALSIPEEAFLLAEDGECSPSLLRPPCWRWMGSAPHPCRGRPAGDGWGALPIPEEAALLVEDGERSPSLWKPPPWRRLGSAPRGCRKNPFCTYPN
jgi:hypothetical protein